MTESDDSNGPKKPAAGDEPAGQEFLPPLDFSSVILPFYTQALLKLGLLSDPDEAGKTMNLNLARRLIDILDLIKDRTKGNLKPDEEDFLTSCLQQLRVHYLEKAKIISG